MRKYDFITIGGVTEDIALYTDEAQIINNQDDILAQKLIGFEYGAKLGVKKSFSSFGGGAGNAAVCLANLGFQTAIIAAVGDDNRGNKIIENFKRKKVKTGLIQKVKNSETGFTFFIIAKDSEHVGFSCRGANTKIKIAKEEIQETKKAKWIYLTSLSGAWKEILSNVFKSQAKIIWNPGHTQLHAGFKSLGRYLAKTEILTINRDEAIELVLSNPRYAGRERSFFEDIENLLTIIKGYGPRIVVITDGKHGAYACDGVEIYFQKVLSKGKPVDTTGVGDAFGSTFAAGIELFGGDIRKAMLAGIENTASVAKQNGAQNGLLARQDLLRRIAGRKA